MFLNEILNDLGLSGVTKNNFLIMNYSGLGVYVQGNISIANYTTVKINIRLSGMNFSITGENLSIKKLTPNSLYITGKIADIIKL